MAGIQTSPITKMVGSATITITMSRSRAGSRRSRRRPDGGRGSVAAVPSGTVDEPVLDIDPVPSRTLATAAR